MTKEQSRPTVLERFSLKDRVVLITGGAGLLGNKHAEAVAECGGIPVILDLNQEKSEEVAERISTRFSVPSLGLAVDITDRKALEIVRDTILNKWHRIDVLINNAANNPKMEKQAEASTHWSHLENFPLETWNADLRVGLTGAFLCCQVFGSTMADRGKGVILNIASDLGVIAPDQRIYRNQGVADELQPVKPVTYSVVKAGLIGLTRYLATYWVEKGLRSNALVPGGVYAGQPDDFVVRLTNLIPMGRMAQDDEYKAAVAFLISDASSYMNGSCMVIDGGRTCW